MGEGPLTMAASQVNAFVRTNDADPLPDVQFHFQPLSASSPGEGLDAKSAFTSAYANSAQRAGVFLNSQLKAFLIREARPRLSPIIFRTKMMLRVSCVLSSMQDVLPKVILYVLMCFQSSNQAALALVMMKS